MLWRVMIFCLHFFLISGENPLVHYEIKFLKEKVDHFTYVATDYFDLRYLVSDDNWTPGGPIFFYTGGEADVTDYAGEQGLMWELAPKFNALLIFAEHRYYGTSLPFGNHAFDNVTTLGYLTSEQALADFASLLYHIKKTVPKADKSKVIAFGGSYPGMLAAWMRLKFPHLIDGAIASSAPILQFAGLTPCSTIARIVTMNYHRGNPECSASIRRSWEVVRNLAKTKSGVRWLGSNFKACTDFKAADLDSLLDWLKRTWEDTAMGNYPYPSRGLPANPVNESCKYLKNSSEPDKVLLSNILKATSVLHNSTGKSSCNDIFRPKIDLWDYQECTELVLPECSDGVNDMFEKKSWDPEAYADRCMRVHGVKPDPEKTPIMFGAKNITATSNIIFSNGKLDPWYGGGILETLSPTLVAYVMDDAAHHLDLAFTNPNDPVHVTEVRKHEENWIIKWLQE